MIENFEKEEVAEDVGLMYNNVLLNSDKFSNIIETRVSESSGSYITEVSELFEELDIEVSENKHLINKTLMEKLYSEALISNQLKEKPVGKTLPF